MRVLQMLTAARWVAEGVQLLMRAACLLAGVRTFWRAAHPHVDALWHQVWQQRLLQWEAALHVDQGWAVQQRVAVMAHTHLQQSQPRCNEKLSVVAGAY
jgi:hypothetical protein